MWHPNPEIYYQIINIFPNASWKYTLLLSGIIIICGIILFFLLEYNRQKTKLTRTTKKRQPIKTILQIGIGSITLLSMLYFFSGIHTVMTGYTHGMYQTNMSWNQMITAIKNSPVENKLPKDKEKLQNAIILYYRFGCEDCESVFHEEQTYFQDYEQVYWISTRSEQGKTLLKQYPVQHVPTGVYITDTNAGITRSLYLDTDKNVEFHSENANDLITLYNGSHSN